jgi:hypothetical protein
MIQRINEENLFFGKINKIDKPLTKLIKRGRRHKLRKLEKGAITPDTNVIERNKIGKYFKNMNSTKLENLKDMEIFLDTYDLAKLNQEYIKNINSPIANNDIKAVIKSLQTRKNPGLDGLAVDFYKTFKELTLMLLKLFY